MGFTKSQARTGWTAQRWQLAVFL